MISREETIKYIVYDINEFIKKTKKLTLQQSSCDLINLTHKQQSHSKNIRTKFKCEGYFLKFHQPTTAPTQYECKCNHFNKKLNNILKNPQLIQKIDSHWPLKKGMVANKINAWQECLSSGETIQLAIAFMIKCISILSYKNKIINKKYFSNNDHSNNYCISNWENAFYFEKILNNSQASLFFWSDIKNFYLQDSFKENNQKKNRFDFYSQILPKQSVILLCFEDSYFRLRSGTNSELFAFEQFINDLTNSDNTLIVFSTQKLIDLNYHKSSYSKDYNLCFKKSLDEKRISLQRAMEPDYRIAKDERYTEPNRVGAFDRLVELLSKGQDYISQVEGSFSKWKNETEN
jgi:hypothetical protein